MTRQQLYKIRYEHLHSSHKYTFCHYKQFNYKILNNIMYLKRAGKGHKDEIYNDVIIMADTETSKETPGTQCKNYVVAWSLSIRAFDMNICTIWGHMPSEFIECLNMIRAEMQGNITIIYFHHLAYDWHFLRKFLIREFGEPKDQLNIKSHYPLFIKFDNGLLFKDSLILAQRTLERWANDLDVEHKKAVGSWDYDKVRLQSDILSSEELKYIECDTLAGVECLQATLKALNKHIYAMPYTATGIPREEIKKRAKENYGKKLFNKLVASGELQLIFEKVFHGGYTHANRHYINMTIDVNFTDGELIKCYDFSSDYPFQLLSKKYPMSKFCLYDHVVTPDFILEHSNKYAFILKLIIKNPRLIDPLIPMPVLQFSKCEACLNPIIDNGRILSADYIELYTNDVDLSVIAQQVDLSKSAITEVYYAKKDYLPRWYTDYIFKCYEDKCKLKGVDTVLYSIAKSKLNSLYGLSVQHPCKQLIVEDYKSGEYTNADFDFMKEYKKFTKKHSSVLLYQWGIFCTSYAMQSLYELGGCFKDGKDGKDGGLWLYSDTDSCYGFGWDETKVKAYNDKCKAELMANGYGAVNVNGKEFWLGVAELDGCYTEARFLGAKRYCCRSAETNKLKITVAGVPKKGVECLKDDINNFYKGFCFDGETTGKLQHTHYIEDDIYIDDAGNERGDSIDLSPTTYVLDDANIDYSFDKLFSDTIDIPIFTEENT